LSFSFYCSLAVLHLDSFPTRRSSDLNMTLFNPRPCGNPLVSCIDHFLKVLIGQYLFGDILSPAYNFGIAFLSHRAILQMIMFSRSEEHTSELQSRENLVCRLLLAKKK